VEPGARKFFGEAGERSCPPEERIARRL